MKVETPAGAVIELGTLEANPTIGLTDYSRRTTDDFGVTTVVQRGFARRISARLAIPADSVDAIQRQLADLRATPAMWVADEQFAVLSLFGLLKDFSLDLAAGAIAYCSLTIEGLTETGALVDSGVAAAPDGLASTFRLLQPVDINDATLISSNVAETDYGHWAAGTYGLGARVVRGHRIWESLTAANASDPAAATGAWLDIGPTNRWAMFDQALGTATSAAGSIIAKVQTYTIEAVALLDVVAATVRVQAVGYDRTAAVVGGAASFLDIPATSGQVTITIAGPGTVSVGTLLAGRIVDLGVTEASSTAAITDYSRKDVDEFGDVTIVQRGWAKRMTAKALIRTQAIDAVAARIAAVRATPSFWVGQSGIDSLTIYGFFKDFSIEVGPGVSKLSLSIEGLSDALILEPTFDDKISEVSNPAVLSPIEKATTFAQADAELSTRSEQLLTLAEGLLGVPAVVAARDAVIMIRTGYYAFRDAIEPPWNDLTAPSPIERDDYREFVAGWRFRLDELADAMLTGAPAGTSVAGVPAATIAQVARINWDEPSALVAGGTLTPIAKKSIASGIAAFKAIYDDLLGQAAGAGVDVADLTAAWNAYTDYVYGLANWASETLDSPVDSALFNAKRNAFFDLTTPVQNRINLTVADASIGGEFNYNARVKPVGRTGVGIASAGAWGLVASRKLGTRAFGIVADLKATGEAWVGLASATKRTTLDTADFAYAFRFVKQGADWKLFVHIGTADPVPYTPIPILPGDPAPTAADYAQGVSLRVTYEDDGTIGRITLWAPSISGGPMYATVPSGLRLAGKMLLGTGASYTGLNFAGSNLVTWAAIAGDKPPIDATAGANVAGDVHTVGATGPDATGYYTFDGSDQMFVVGSAGETATWTGEPYLKITVETKDDTGVGAARIGVLCDTVSSGQIALAVDARQGGGTIVFPLGTTSYKVFHAVSFTSGSIKMKRAVVVPTQEPGTTSGGASGPDVGNDGINGALQQLQLGAAEPPGAPLEDVDSGTLRLFAGQIAGFSSGNVPAGTAAGFSSTFGARFIFLEQARAYATSSNAPAPYGVNQGAISLKVTTRNAAGDAQVLGTWDVSPSGAAPDGPFAPNVREWLAIPEGHTLYRAELIVGSIDNANGYVRMQGPTITLRRIRETDNQVVIDLGAPVDRTDANNIGSPAYYAFYKHPADPSQAIYEVKETWQAASAGFQTLDPAPLPDLEVVTRISRDGTGVAYMIAQETTVRGVRFFRTWRSGQPAGQWPDSVPGGAFDPALQLIIDTDWSKTFSAAQGGGPSTKQVLDESGAAQSDATLITGQGTAAAITGQGDLATQDAASWATQVDGVGKPADNASATSALVAFGTGAVTVQGNTATKTSSGFDWNAGVYSRLAFKGSAYVTARSNSGGSPLLIGLSADPAAAFVSQGHAIIYPCLYCNGSGWFVNAGGSALPGYDATAVPVVAYTGSTIRMTLNGELVAEYATATGQSLRGYVAFYGQWSAREIEVGALGDSSFQALGGLGLGRGSFKTDEGTAAGFTGEGDLARKDKADFATDVVGAGKPAANADVTAVNVPAAPPVAALSVPTMRYAVGGSTDYGASAGNALVSSDTPASAFPQRLHGGIDVTRADGTTWTAYVTAAVAGSIDVTNGSPSKGRVLVTALGSALGLVVARSIYQGVATDQVIELRKRFARPAVVSEEGFVTDFFSPGKSSTRVPITARIVPATSGLFTLNLSIPVVGPAAADNSTSPRVYLEGASTADGSDWTVIATFMPDVSAKDYDAGAGRVIETANFTTTRMPVTGSYGAFRLTARISGTVGATLGTPVGVAFLVNQ